MPVLGDAYNHLVLKLIPYILLLGIIILGLEVFRLKYWPKIKWHIIKLLSRLLKKSPPDTEYDNEIVKYIEYNEFSRELYIVINSKKKLVKTPQYDSNTEKLIRYLYKHPNQDITKKTLINDVNLSPKANLSKLVNELGFKGKNRSLFFNISKDSIKLTNPIRRKHIL